MLHPDRLGERDRRRRTDPACSRSLPGPGWFQMRRSTPRRRCARSSGRRPRLPTRRPTRLRSRRTRMGRRSNPARVRWARRPDFQTTHRIAGCPRSSGTKRSQGPTLGMYADARGWQRYLVDERRRFAGIEPIQRVHFDRSVCIRARPEHPYRSTRHEHRLRPLARDRNPPDRRMGFDLELRELECGCARRRTSGCTSQSPSTQTSLPKSLATGKLDLVDHLVRRRVDAGDERMTARLVGANRPPRRPRHCRWPR